MKKMRQTLRIGNYIKEYFSKHLKEYLITILIFSVGIFFGVMFINSMSEDKESLLTEYIEEFEEKYISTEKIETKGLLLESIKNNISTSGIIFLAGTTIIGMPVVIGMIFFRGFCIGYTISGITLLLGTWKGLIFCFASLLLQNILFIPALLTLGVSSINLYKSIKNDKKRENIKYEIIKHIIISLVMMIILILAGIIESKISSRILKLVINYTK